MIAAAVAAFEEIFTPPFRAVLLKTMGLTVLLLAVLWAIIEKLVVTFVHVPWGWLQTTINVLSGAGLVVGLVFLVTPVSFVVAGLFFDEMADHVEADIAGPDGRGRAMDLLPALWLGLKFGLISLLVLIGAVALTLIFPGVNLVIFYVANAYIFGRGFFELAALRYRPLDEVRDMRRVHSFRIFLAGCLPAALALVPLVGILTPLFATALLVRVAQPIVRRRLLNPPDNANTARLSQSGRDSSARSSGRPPA